MRIRLAFLALVLLTLGACDSTDPEEDGFHGTYTLFSVSGSPLPFVLQDDDLQKLEVLNGDIVLSTNGFFSDRIAYRVTPVGGTAGPLNEHFTGAFTRTGTGFTFSPGAGQGQGAYVVELTEDGELVLGIGSHPLLYRK